MAPKEKAKELFDKFMKPVDGMHKYPMCFDTAKQCALIAVDEIKKSIPYFEYDNHHQLKINVMLTKIEEFWMEVKKEIENYEIS